MSNLLMLAAGIFAINFAPIANRAYLDTPEIRGWIENRNFISLNDMPDGIQKYGGIPFKVTNSKRPGGHDFLCLTKSKQFQGVEEREIRISPGKKFSQISLLHAGGYVTKGEIFGEIICKYTDGTVQRIPIQAGRDIADWYGASPAENCRTAFVHPNHSIFGNVCSSFELKKRELHSLTFRTVPPKAVWLLSAVTLSEEKIPLAEIPEHQKDSPLIPGKPAVPQNASKTGDSYRFVLLGDIHFDAEPEIYHQDYREPDSRLNAIQRAEFARNAEMWRERCPKLVKAAKKQITPDTAFVIQLGDLVNGDCGNPKTHEKMMNDALSYFTGTFGSIPFLVCVGNHDIRGLGAEGVCRKILPEYHSGVLRKKIQKTSFYFRRKSDLFLFIDFNDPDLQVIETAFRENGDARYKFVFSHGPVLPSDDSDVHWFLAGNCNRLRKDLRELFLKNNVVVFCGHVHDLEYTRCSTNKGTITQLMANSVWKKDSPDSPFVTADTPADYGKFQKEKYHSVSGQELLAEYQPAISNYWKAEGAGFFTIDVTPESIKASFFSGASSTPCKTFNLQ